MVISDLEKEKVHSAIALLAAHLSVISEDALWTEEYLPFLLSIAKQMKENTESILEILNEQ